jgi:hypothetical protein
MHEPRHHNNSLNKTRIAILGFLAFITIVIGFALGRGTGDLGNTDEVATPTTDKKWSILPPLPKDVGQTLDPGEKSIIVETPAEGSSVQKTFIVSGRTQTTNTVITVTVKDGSGFAIAQGKTSQYTEQNAGFGRFSISINLGSYQGSAKIIIDGTNPDTHVERSVTVKEKDALSTKVFFGKKGVSDQNCEAVFPIDRQISVSSAVYREIVESLLKGPENSEKTLGYFTSIPSGVRVKSIAADANGVVTVDFDRTLDARVAGSCRVSAIRSQIIATLKQFPEVRDVIILVEGRGDTALQP